MLLLRRPIPGTPSAIPYVEPSKWWAKIGVAQHELDLGQHSRVERAVRAVLNEIQEFDGADIPSPLAEDIRKIGVVAEALLGQTLTAQRRIEEASASLRRTITEFESAPERDGWTSRDWAAYGVALDLLGRPREAEQALQTAIDLSDPPPAICRRLGVLLAAADRLDPAEQMLRKGLSADASNVQSIRLLADVLKASKRPQESASAYRQAGLVAAAARRFGEALELFHEAVDLDPDAELYLAIGDSLRQLGHLEEALEALTRSLELQPDSAVALTTRGVVLYGLGEHEAALGSVNRARMVDPGLAIANAIAGDVLCRLERYDEASFFLENARAIDPNDAWTMSSSGQVLRSMGRVVEARDVLRAAVVRAPDLSWAWAELGEAERLLGYPKEAVRATEEALRRDPTHHLALGAKGLALSQLGQQEEAAKTLQVLTKLAPDNAWAWGQYGRLLRVLGRRSEAISALLRSLQLDPSLEWAAADLAALRADVAREDEEPSHSAEAPAGRVTGRWRWRSPF